MGMKSRLFASAAFPLLSLSLALQPATAMAAVRDVATQASAVQQAEQGSFEVAQDAPSEEELLKKKRKQQEEAPAEKPAQQEAPAEKPKAERKEAPAPEPKAEPEPPKAEAAPKEEPAPQPESKPARKAKSEAQPEAKPEAEQPVTQEKPKKPKKPEAQQAEPEQQPAAKEAQPEAEQAQPEAKPEGGKRDKGQDKAQGRDKGKGKAEKEAQPAAPDAVTPTAESAKPEATPEAKPAAEAPAEKKPAKGETAAPADKAPTDKATEGKATEGKATEDKAAAPEAAPAEKPKDGTAAKPAGEQPAGAQPAAPATDTAQPLPDASGGQQVEQAIPAPEKVSPEELERRKKIAADPAKSSETVVLPVENGAAVLDSDKDADRSKGREGRRDRDRQRADSQEVKVPTSDADAQALSGAKAPAPVKLEAVTREKGRKLDERPRFVRPDGARFDDRGSDDSRVIIQYDNRTIVRGDDDRRFLRDGERPSYEELSGDRYRETITRPEGYRIVTIRNRYGDIIQRSRVDARGREDVLYYSQDLYDDPDRDYFEDPGADLPPMRLRVPLSDYIIDTRSDPNRDYYEFLSEPPVEPVERVYSLDEVKYSARIRDKVRRIDLDTITFATGSADIPMTQARTLRKVADAISQVLEKDPSETFLIEGHTDAVGSDQSNLILSDQRAESVANVLSDVYGIAPENLATQGYGESYLKVNTSAPEQENRRVTIRRVTALVRPVAANK
ncbi:OmpA family protein [Rhizobium leguminosarum]|uniref:OmpA family protein n=1 Tax=Rhizobium johnstonii (strain DSM 114642 / LMG 32736 / 3841) TaxID=216596 RepID=Q1MFN3_RHIJ3|nr:MULTISPECIES: OmpA family protein [Rhizobium]WSH06130.1 OmpA family protein [Rhizobium johnstonii]MBY5372127.1 OmpA family protein [Rhizobium leguminosarum]NEI89261.1 OmpA family protein [Rhizobium leguminosarum]NEJ75136.1 OmpA family protein [Rhizobium leguminosarum]TBF40871.1 OmpA family protein [Rhizobium leguminosarum]